MVSRPAPRIGRNAVTLRSSTTCKTPLGAVTWFSTSRDLDRSKTPVRILKNHKHPPESFKTTNTHPNPPSNPPKPQTPTRILRYTYLSLPRGFRRKRRGAGRLFEPTGTILVLDLAVVYYCRTYVKAVRGGGVKRGVARGDVCYGVLRAAACVDAESDHHALM